MARAMQGLHGACAFGSLRTTPSVPHRADASIGREVQIGSGRLGLLLAKRVLSEAFDASKAADAPAALARTYILLLTIKSTLDIIEPFHWMAKTHRSWRRHFMAPTRFKNWSAYSQDAACRVPLASAAVRFHVTSETGHPTQRKEAATRRQG
jgi:hypothetical protein